MTSTELLDLDAAREHVRWHLAEGDIQKVADIAMDALSELKQARADLIDQRAQASHWKSMYETNLWGGSLE